MAGVDYEDFWNYEPSEVIEIMKAFTDKREADCRFQAALVYKSAQLNALAFSGEIPPIEDVFPSLFQKPEIKQDWREQEAILNRLNNLKGGNN